MFDEQPHAGICLKNARIVTPDAVVTGTVEIDAGRISRIAAGTRQSRAGLDLEGAILIPGIVDIHTDHVERHTHPRTTVLWPFLPALMAMTRW